MIERNTKGIMDKVSYLLLIPIIAGMFYLVYNDSESSISKEDNPMLEEAKGDYINRCDYIVDSLSKIIEEGKGMVTDSILMMHYTEVKALKDSLRKLESVIDYGKSLINRAQNSSKMSVDLAAEFEAYLNDAEYIVHNGLEWKLPKDIANTIPLEIVPPSIKITYDQPESVSKEDIEDIFEKAIIAFDNERSLYLEI